MKLTEPSLSLLGLLAATPTLALRLSEKSTCPPSQKAILESAARSCAVQATAAAQAARSFEDTGSRLMSTYFLTASPNARGQVAAVFDAVAAECRAAASESAVVADCEAGARSGGWDVCKSDGSDHGDVWGNHGPAVVAVPGGGAGDVDRVFMCEGFSRSEKQATEERGATALRGSVVTKQKLRYDGAGLIASRETHEEDLVCRDNVRRGSELLRELTRADALGGAKTNAPARWPDVSRALNAPWRRLEHAPSYGFFATEAWVALHGGDECVVTAAEVEL